MQRSNFPGGGPKQGQHAFERFWDRNARACFTLMPTLDPFECDLAESGCSDWSESVVLCKDAPELDEGGGCFGNWVSAWTLSNF